MPDMSEKPVVIVGAGLAGLVAAFELSKRQVPTVILEQENEANLGGQAFWSLGGLFCVDSRDQRRWGVRDSRELAMQDWMGSAGFDREREDRWPRQWAEAFVRFATDELEQYVKSLGLKFSSVGWAERGNGRADGHGNSVPRFHLTWGSGPEVVRIFADPVRAAAETGVTSFRFRHRVNELVVDDETGAVVGVRGEVLEPTDAERGAASSRNPVDAFELSSQAVLIASGGMGGNVDMVRRHWPLDRLGPKVPESFVVGVPAHVDGRMMEIAQSTGASWINSDRMWHYTEGLINWNPIWPQHGIRVLPGPSSLWLDATGKRLPPFLYPGSDTLSTLKHICATGYDYSWFIADKTVIAREFSLSGSEQNPDITGKSIWLLLQRVFGSNGTGPVQDFMRHGQDFIVRNSLEELVEGMNQLVDQTGGVPVDLDQIRSEVELRDMQIDNKYSKDAQVMLVRNGQNFWPEGFARITKLHKILDPSHGPLVAVKMHLLTRKSLGGLETDLSTNVLRSDGSRFPNLYAAGEAAGFGGGGVHGYNSLEGSFLGGCIFTGRTAGRAIAESFLC